MPKEVPHFNNEAVAHLAMELYGIEGEISALVSYEDQNARIKTSDGTYVLRLPTQSGLPMRWLCKQRSLNI